MNQETPKIKIGVKGKDSGFVFYPYIPIIKLSLPWKFIRLDENNQPVFTKLKQNKNDNKDI
jgi:hypothetical protein